MPAICHSVRWRNCSAQKDPPAVRPHRPRTKENSCKLFSAAAQSNWTPWGLNL